MEIEDLINNVTKQDFSKAEPTFKEIMSVKVNDALEQEKIGIASQLFNQVTDGESDDAILGDPDDIEDPTDEEIEDELEEMEDEDDEQLELELEDEDGEEAEGSEEEENEEEN